MERSGYTALSGFILRLYLKYFNELLSKAIEKWTIVTWNHLLLSFSYDFLIVSTASFVRYSRSVCFRTGFDSDSITEGE